MKNKKTAKNGEGPVALSLKSKVAGLVGLLQKQRDSFDRALAGRMDVDMFIQYVATLYMNDEKLQNCTDLSIYRAAIECALSGLKPDGEEAYIIPWGGEAQFAPGFQGYVRLMLRAGARKVEADVVRTGDEFRWNRGLNPDLYHVPALSGNRGEVTHAYAIVWLQNGETQFEVMDRDELDKVRAASKAPNSPAWKGWQSQMERKAPVRRLRKYIELDAAASAAFRLDSMLTEGRRADFRDLHPPAETRSVDERARAHAIRQTEEFRSRIAEISAGATGANLQIANETEEVNDDEVLPFNVTGQTVGFGKHRDLTWGDVLEQQRGYVTHYVLEGGCPHVSEDVKAALRAFLEQEEDAPPEQIPDPDALAALQERGSAAIVALRRANKIGDEAMADFGSEIAMMSEEGDFFGLQDAVDELERRAAAVGSGENADLFEDG